MFRLILCITLFSSPLFAIQPNDVLNFWLGTLDERECGPGKNTSKWFSGGQVDNEIRDHFYSSYREALFGRLTYWKQTPRGRLALIILLDQFSRNLFRESAEAFLADSLALSLSLEGIEQGDDLYLLPVERAFFYLPLEHAEDHQMQELSVCRFQMLANETQTPLFENFLDYAQRHKVIIDRFGRYPHRNKTLNRPSTKEEEEFLLEERSSF